MGEDLPSCETSLESIINSTEPGCKLWISSSGSVHDSWDWIGSEHIQPGESMYMTLRLDTYDIRDAVGWGRADLRSSGLDRAAGA